MGECYVNSHITHILDFKEQKGVGKCNECQKEMYLNAYRVALDEIINILLKLPINP